MKGRLTSLLGFVLLLGTGCAPTLQVDRDPVTRTRMYRWLQASDLTSASVAFQVVDLQTGEEWAAYRAQKNQLPASSLKLLVAWTALHRWGPAHRFHTLLATDSLRRDTAFSLYLKGFGDPSVRYEDLLRWVDRLQARGVRVITGRLVADESYLDTVRLGRGWMWDEGAGGWVARTGALSMDENTVELWIRPGDAPGAPATLALVPPDSAILVQNRLHTDTLPTRYTYARGVQEGHNLLTVEGTVNLHEPLRIHRVNLDDPAGHVLRVFRDLLIARGIQVQATLMRGISPQEAETLLVASSPPLHVILYTLLKHSSNFVAEQLLKILGAEVYGPPGTAEKGLRVIRTTLTRCGLRPDTYVQVDASGVSRYNQISPGMLTGLLRCADRDPLWGPEFLTLLPIGGVDGTLAH
ncbi:MAG: D-alanyl-D-alanine carboxypeptidase/D-alanyl-D-alanine-endopeptidase, partial [Candidatus Hydrothermae bacterium]|nr:D-alanyl-D-alanine carboxypeptidase/D-alanyl-D-alanine-endopeptidase [Candidatus Hydrothermae bacterium]